VIAAGFKSAQKKHRSDLNQGRYTLRAGFFDLPFIPNTVSLDPSWKQFQAIVELEERHEFMEQPGKLKVTGFLTHARNGAFADAIKLAAATADIAAVRRFRDRTGVSLNLEQQLMPHVGIFARAGVADGNIEPEAFTPKLFRLAVIGQFAPRRQDGKSHRRTASLPDDGDLLNHGTGRPLAGAR
jgi:hypothetical protein